MARSKIALLNTLKPMSSAIHHTENKVKQTATAKKQHKTVTHAIIRYLSLTWAHLKLSFVID